MALPAWPPGLPPLVGLAGTLGTSQLYEPAQETEMDDGAGRTRNRVLFRKTRRSIVLLLSRAQFVAFKDFTTLTLNNGARRFTAPVRLPDGTLGTRTCRIAGPVSEADAGPHSRVAFNLDVWSW